jgi:hypothetical protein
MAVKRGTALRSKNSFAFIWYLLAWFTFRTLPILYFKVTSNAEAEKQKKWGSKVRGFLSCRTSYGRGLSVTRLYKSPLTHSVSFANKQDYSAELQLNDSLYQIPPTAGLFKGVKNYILDVISYIKSSRELCWFVLILSIMAETGATTLSKYAIEKSSSNLLLLACFMVVIR